MRKKFLKKITRFGVGGSAYAVEVKENNLLPSIVQNIKKSKKNFFVLGGGTNIIAHDKGYTGVVLLIKTKDMKVSGSEIQCDAGVSLQALVDEANRNSLSGIETLAGIPGTVGGALYGNAGAYGREIADVVTRVSIFDGIRTRNLSKKECSFYYRGSIFKRKKWIILSAAFIFQKGNKKNLEQKSKDIVELRRKKYPPRLRCAGSIFKNILLQSTTGKKLQRMIPKEKIIKGKIPAGVLLESVGAKGMKRGSIVVADYHANLIINTGKGKAKDVKYIIDKLKKKVYKKYGILLEEEVQYLGF